MAPVLNIVAKLSLLVGAVKVVEYLMSYRDRTYVIFDGDNDQWAYRYMRGWRENDNIDFDFVDAHDIRPLTARADQEAYIKGVLRERMANAKQVIVLIGESTKNLYKFVRWELDLALQKKLPIIAVNLNGARSQDDLCPAVIRNKGNVIHVPFKLKAIRYALDQWPGDYRSKTAQELANGAWHYNPDVYQKLGL